MGVGGRHGAEASKMGRTGGGEGVGVGEQTRQTRMQDGGAGYGAQQRRSAHGWGRRARRTTMRWTGVAAQGGEASGAFVTDFGSDSKPA